jgi:triacylglycerol lipase
VAYENVLPYLDKLKPVQITGHNGVEVMLVAEKQYAMVQGLKSIMRATKFISVLPSEDNFRAHEIGSYLTLIDI